MFIRTIVILFGLMMLSSVSAHDKGHHGYQSKSVGGRVNSRHGYNRRSSGRGHHNGWGHHKKRHYDEYAYRPRRYVERCFPIYQFYINGIGFSIVDECGIRKRIYLDDRWNYAHPR